MELNYRFEAGQLAESRTAIDHFYSLIYEELRRLASAVRRGDPSMTLNTTALVHEAWIKLAASPQFATATPLHFKRIAARAMRQLLVESARRRHALKRGGDILIVNLDDAAAAQSETDLIALDDALERLAQLNARQAHMIEARFFGGLAMNEISELLGISEATLLRDWRAAKAWLASELRSPGEL